jgi:hypothetical protein
MSTRTSQLQLLLFCITIPLDVTESSEEEELSDEGDDGEVEEEEDGSSDSDEDGRLLTLPDMVMAAVQHQMASLKETLEELVRVEVEKQVRILHAQVTEKRPPGRPPKRQKVRPTHKICMISIYYSLMKRQL